VRLPTPHEAIDRKAPEGATLRMAEAIANGDIRPALRNERRSRRAFGIAFIPKVDPCLDGAIPMPARCHRKQERRLSARVSHPRSSFQVRQLYGVPALTRKATVLAGLSLIESSTR
jgi:hypothetical protein